MKSMTAFGESYVETELGKVTIEIRSENHRFLDLKIQTSDSLNSIEPLASELMNDHVIRGKLRLKISLTENSKSLTTKNDKLFKQNYKLLNKAKNEIGIKDDIKIEHLLLFKDIFENDTELDISKTTTKKILSCIDKALKKFISNREIEGRKLKKDVIHRIKLIKQILRDIKKKRKNFAKEASEKIIDRIQKLLNDPQIDQERLIQEVAFLTERSDISEELVRLDAHISKFTKTSNESGSIGKELDFLVQEMNRECGTISAKCKDAEISHLAISLRSELEKIREQIQNIE